MYAGNMDTIFLKCIVARDFDDNVTDDLIMNDGIDCHPSDQDKFRTAITRSVL